MEQDIVNYIQEARKHGLSDVEIKQNLLNTGWEAGVVEESFTHAKAQDGRMTGNKDEDMIVPDQHPLQKPLVGESSPPLFSAGAASEPQSSVPPHSPLVNATTAGPYGQSNTAGRKTSRVLKVAAVAVIFFLLLGGLGWAYYTYFYNSPTKVWNKFITSILKDDVYQSRFTASYSDAGDTGPSEDVQLKDIKLTFTGDFYVNSKDKENPSSSSTIAYTFASGNTSISTGLQYALVNKILYFKVGDNPFLNSMAESLASGRDIDWVKIDLAEVAKADAGEETPANEFSKTVEDVFDAGFREELSRMWEDARFVTVDQYVGREKIDGSDTLHFRNKLDKQAMKDLLANYITKIGKRFQEHGESVQEEDLTSLRQVTDALVDKIEVREFETWIGSKDFRLHKVHFVSNAPSVISAIQSPLGAARAKSRDAKRLADIRQIASSLELYFNDYTGYPAGNQGVPMDLSPTYIGQVPVAPTPADGGCTEYYNSYWYVPEGEAKIVNGKTVYPSYQMTFCLGETIGGYAAGIGKLTPTEITGNIPCPGSVENCGSAGVPQDTTMIKDEREQAVEMVRGINFSAELTVDMTYSEFGKVLDLEAPENAFDLGDLLGGSVLGAFTRWAEEN